MRGGKIAGEHSCFHCGSNIRWNYETWEEHGTKKMIGLEIVATGIGKYEVMVPCQHCRMMNRFEHQE